jgi:hypothetical protein
MYSHPASFGIESSSDIADVLSAIHRGLPDFDTGTRSLRSLQSTCSHFAWVTSLRRAPVSIKSRMALAAVRFSSTVIASTRHCASPRVRKRLRCISWPSPMPPVGLRVTPSANDRVVADPDHGDRNAGSTTPSVC